MRTEQENTELFLNNERLVGKVYHDWFAWFKGYEEDLMSAGRMGLWRACVNYDESKGIKFSSFACKCIKNEMCIFARKEFKYHINTTSYDVLMPDGTKNDITELTPNGQYEEMLSKADLEVRIKEATYKDDFRRVYDGETMAGIARNKDLSRQAISRRIVSEREKIIDKSL